MNRGMLKEKLGNYQVDPPEKVWDEISGQIAHGRKRRGMYILLLATAASIALAISLGLHFFGPDLPGEQAGVSEQAGVTEIDRQQGEPAETVRETEDGQSLARSPDPVPSEIQETRQVLAVQEAFESEVQSDQEEFKYQEAMPDTEEYKDQEAISDMEAAHDPLPEQQPDTALEMIMDPFPVLEQDKKRNSSWMVGAAISPLYSYRDADAVAMPSNQAESGLLSYSTGVHVRYRRNSRLAFETGIYYNRTGINIGAPGIRVFSQNYDNMVFGYGSESADINDVSNSVGNIVAYSGDIYMNGYKINAENGRSDFQSQVLDDVQIAESGIQQHLDYLELPFNLRYSVIDRTFELQLVGGMSTNFLVGNTVTMEGSAGREEIGYLSNVNTVNYSGNAGLGMIYHMGKNFSLSLEPRFRYFINSVNDSSLPATRPYSLGFYTGLSYTF
jgi:hypothetical protein